MSSRAAKLTLLALMVASFVFVGRAQVLLADSVANASVLALMRLTAPWRVSPVKPAVVEEEKPKVDAGLDLSAAFVAGKVRRSTGPAGRAPQPPKSLFVSAASVLKLSKSAAQPGGTFVTSTAQHPAGIRLTGVSALGIGVLDGDILVDALGFPARARAQIIGAIIEARARRSPVLSGTLWRAGHTFTISVEQPYVDPA